MGALQEEASVPRVYMCGGEDDPLVVVVERDGQVEAWGPLADRLATAWASGHFSKIEDAIGWTTASSFLTTSILTMSDEEV